MPRNRLINRHGVLIDPTPGSSADDERAGDVLLASRDVPCTGPNRHTLHKAVSAHFCNLFCSIMGAAMGQTV
jgi:hypothetical protein